MNHPHTDTSAPPITSNVWSNPAIIAENNFQFKSLSNWSFNTAVGCGHGCLFCYVPSTSVNKQAMKLADYGVQNPESEWGHYVFVRPWDETAFLKSLAKAERTSWVDLKPDGNRAVMLSTTTDPYQVIRNSDPKRGSELTRQHQELVRRALVLIRDRSSLNVRILTRSPLARCDFDLMKTFGNRLLFGMSLPTLDDQLSRIFEPHAPSPGRRLETLVQAKAAGLHVFVAIAPTFPCVQQEQHLYETFLAVSKLEPVTVFSEPINIRSENVARIEKRATPDLVNLNVFQSRQSWEKYAVAQLELAERMAELTGIKKRLHLWPDKSLGTASALARASDPAARKAWLGKWWSRISEWPQ